MTATDIQTHSACNISTPDFQGFLLPHLAADRGIRHARDAAWKCEAPVGCLLIHAAV
jgi:hypothetical protein